MASTQSPDALPGLAKRRPAAVCAGLALSAGARDCLSTDPSPSDFLRALLNGGHLRDALEYLAYALPRRVAVGWACACVAAARAGSLAPEAEAALRAALQWTETPDARSCARAALVADHDGMQDEGAARFAALAAAWSGESLAPEGQPAVPPAEALGAAAAAAAVVIASSSDVHATHERQREFVAMAILAAQSVA